MEQGKDFIKKLVIGIILAALYLIIYLPRRSVVDSVISILAVGVMLFTSPWGWSLPNKAIAKGSTDLILPIPLYLAIKLMCAVFLGWIMFFVDFVKLFVKK